jgi:uncharacterized repeat protein (TIGR03803 family)
MSKTIILKTTIGQLLRRAARQRLDCDQTVMTKLTVEFHASAVFVLGAATAISLQSQTFTTLHSFASTDGYYPVAGLVQGSDGNFYGTTLGGGLYNRCSGGCGTVFTITSTGTLTTLHNFCAIVPYCEDGASPVAGLILGTNGDLYGTTEGGGSQSNAGTVFSISASGKLTILHPFCAGSDPPYCPDGWSPATGLVQAGGQFYGTTNYSEYGGGGGTIFRVSADGGFATIYDFCAQNSACPDGEQSSGLVQGGDGEFYGTTAGGGANQEGTVFKISPAGSLTTLYSFCSQSGCADGQTPHAGLIRGSNGNFFGTTPNTAFEITPTGSLTTLYTFCVQETCPDGSQVIAGLVLATDGNFYGTATLGPSGFGGGSVFRMTPNGMVTVLYDFCPNGNDCSDGFFPTAPVIQATDGNLYGTTKEGGLNHCELGCGTVFSLSVGLGPFVEIKPTSGKTGSSIKILGTDLGGATGVSFDGTPAVFTLLWSSEITATVPTGASSGKIQVFTPGATLTYDGRCSWFRSR